MSCGCNSTPCCCGTVTVSVTPRVCCTPTTESVTYEFENGNLNGIGFFDNETDNLVQLRGIVSNSLALILTLDAPNKSIVIDFDGDLLITDIPTFTETVRGIGEAATQAETNAGIVDNVIITPLKLFSMLATETQRGIAEVATQAEVTTGTSDVTIVTPLKLATFAGTQATTRVFADAVARAAAVPTFDGQLGVQLDTNAIITANGTIAGSFSPNMVVLGDLTVSGAAISASGTTATFGSLAATEATFDSAAFSVTSGVGVFVNAPLSFESGTEFQISGSPATQSVLVGRALGAADAMTIASFLSTDNVQTGYTNFANGAVLRTCDTTTVTLPQLAQIVGTLINDLKAVLLPAT